MFNTKHLFQCLGAVAMLAGVNACGGGGGGGGNPAGPGPGGGSPGTSGATITISAQGVVSPTAVTINSGESVTFVSNDGRARQISSNPHPEHTDCPAINALGNITAGQTRLTNALTTARTCGFHDHNDPDNPALKGTITVR